MPTLFLAPFTLFINRLETYFLHKMRYIGNTLRCPELVELGIEKAPKNPKTNVSHMVKFLKSPNDRYKYPLPQGFHIIYYDLVPFFRIADHFQRSKLFSEVKKD